MMLSLVPREFHTFPRAMAGAWRGRRASPTSVWQAIFRNLAPFVGNQALELEDRLVPFADDYLPRAGDRLVILVLQPPIAATRDHLRELEGREGQRHL